MPRRVFYSFHYAKDAWRAGQVRNIGAIEGNQPASGNDWEEIKKGGDEAIKRWIHEQMKGRSCVVVLIGAETAKRKWVRYEIKHGWNERKGVLGVCIHNLKDRDGNTSPKGANPFDLFTIEVDGEKIPLSSVVQTYDPPSNNAYGHIKDNLADWIDDAIYRRNNV